MKTIELVPFSSCGEISSKDNRNKISNRFKDYYEFKKSPFSDQLTGVALGGNIHIYYRDDFCSGVEVFRPIDLVFNSINFMKISLLDVTDILNIHSIDFKISDYGLDMDELGVYMYSHDFVETLECYADSIYVSFLRNVHA